MSVYTDTTVQVNLSSLGWPDKAPSVLQPLEGFTFATLTRETEWGGAYAPYLQHVVGEWSLEKVAHERGILLDEASEDELFVAAGEASDVWLRLANHAMQGDIADDQWWDLFSATQRGSPQWIHGVHGVTWRLLSLLMKLPDSSYKTPSANVWSIIQRLCGAAGEVDYGLYVGCTHGLGHSLAFYFSSGTASHSEALSPCYMGAESNDPRLSFNCVSGYFHEWHRAGLWKIGTQHLFDPFGTTKPCGGPLANLPGEEYACFSHMRVGQKYTPLEWFETETASSKHGVRASLHLTPLGQRSISKDLSFCYTAPYPGYTGVGQASCVALFAWNLVNSAIMAQVDATGAAQDEIGDLKYDIASFAALMPAPSTVVDLKPSVPRLQHMRGSVTTGTLLTLVCEGPGLRTSYWVWLGCVHQNVPAAKFFPDAGLNALASGTAVYARAGSRHQRDPWTAINDGAEERADVRECSEMFEPSVYVAGTETELAFAQWLCVRSVQSHGASLHPLIGWDQLQENFTTFEARYTQSGSASSRKLRASRTSTMEPTAPDRDE